MAFGNIDAACACDWFSGVSTNANNCQVQTPGFNRNIFVMCLNNFVASLNANQLVQCGTYTMLDTTVVEENAEVYGSIDKSSEARAVRIYAKKDTVGVTSGESINDAGGKDISETLLQEATIDVCNIQFYKKYIGKEVIALLCDNDQQAWIMGYGGGLILNDWTGDWGVATGDNKAITANFINTSKPTIAPFNADTTIYNDTFNTNNSLGLPAGSAAIDILVAFLERWSAAAA